MNSWPQRIRLAVAALRGANLVPASPPQASVFSSITVERSRRTVLAIPNPNVDPIEIEKFDGRLLVTAGHDLHVKYWDPEAGEAWKPDIFLRKGDMLDLRAERWGNVNGGAQ